MSLEQRIAQKRAEAAANEHVEGDEGNHFSADNTEALPFPHKTNDPDAMVIGIEQIIVRPQVREQFDPQGLEELADDIAAHGQDAPILVRPIYNNRFELVAGERRLRAKKILQQRDPSNSEHQRIRATVRSLDDEQKTNRQLAENIHREDLKPLELAKALDEQKTKFGYTDAQLAEKIKKDRSFVSRYLGLLKLSPELQYLVANDEIKPRAALKHKEKLVEEVVAALPAGLREKQSTGEMTTLEALQVRDQWQVSGDGADEPSASLDLVSVTSKKSQKTTTQRSPKVSVSLEAAEAMADILKELAADLGLNPIAITKQKGRSVRKELLAALDSRAPEILQAYRNR